MWVRRLFGLFGDPGSTSLPVDPSRYPKQGLVTGVKTRLESDRDDFESWARKGDRDIKEKSGNDSLCPDNTEIKLVNERHTGTCTVDRKDSGESVGVIPTFVVVITDRQNSANGRKFRRVSVRKRLTL